MRSGSLVDVNQLSALQRPRVLSSLQTNPVREVAAERCHGPRTQPNTHIHSQTHTHTQILVETWGETLQRCWHLDNHPGEFRGDEGEKKKKKKRLGNKHEARRTPKTAHTHTKNSNKAKGETQMFSWKSVWGRRRRKKWTNKKECVWKEGNTPPPLVPSVTPMGWWEAARSFRQHPRLARHTSHTTAHNKRSVARIMLTQGAGRPPT